MTNREKIKEIFPYMTKQMLAEKVNIFEWWNAEYKEPITNNDLGVDWDELKRKIFMEVDGGTDDAWLAYGEVCNRIGNSIDDFKANLPSVTPQEPKTGYWIEHPHEAGPNWEYSRYECSECHDWAENDSDYCPDCGTKMVEPQESEDKE